VIIAKSYNRALKRFVGGFYGQIECWSSDVNMMKFWIFGCGGMRNL